MSPIITTAQPTIPQLQIATREIIPHVLPSIAMGDMLRLTVRQNSKEGQGLLYFRGHIIPAQLPLNLEQGDQIIAQVSNSGNQLVLKIVDMERPSETRPAEPLSNLTQKDPISQLAQQLAGLVRDSGLSALQQFSPLPLPGSLKNLGEDLPLLKNLFAALGDQASLLNAKTALAHLTASTEGSLPQALKQLSLALRQMAAKTENENLSLQQSAQGAAEGARIESKSGVELLQLATRLEQFASAQEMLNQLNPLMQALGEPSLILFPFLFHGLLSHSQVTVDSRDSGKQQGKHSTGKEKKDAEQTFFHRIQVTVPLPNIGIVDVDIAHNQTDILIRMIVQDAEAGSFLVSQMETLSEILRAQGFDKPQLSASVDLRQSALPQWTLGLQASTTVVA